MEDGVGKGPGNECYFIKLGESLPDKVTFWQKDKGNDLGRNIGKGYAKVLRWSADK